MADRADLRWWDQPAGKLASVLEGTIDVMLAGSRARHDLDLRHARYYGGQKYLGLGPSQYHRTAAPDRLKLNVIASCVQTAVAKITKNRPAPQFLTNGADYDTRRKALKLNKFGRGVQHQARVFEVGEDVQQDACIFGTGLGKVVRTPRDTIGLERTFPWDVLVDPIESLHGKPRQMVQRRYVDRAVLLDLYGKGDGGRARRKVIENAKAPDGSTWFPGYDRTCDQVEVFEAWRLRSGPDAKDGRHAIIVRGGELFEERWERDRFPFAVLRWERPIAGFWGTGIAERLNGIQFEINELLAKVQYQMRTMGVTKVIVDAASGVPVSYVNDKAGVVYVVNSGAGEPRIVAPQSVHPELIAQINLLYQRAFQEVGISEMVAQSTKPAGLDSGKALRDWNDIGSERMVPKSRHAEQWHMDVVDLAIDEAREIPGFEVDVPTKREAQRVKWADVNLERDAYVLQCFPASILSQTPSGRIQDVQELVGMGAMSEEQMFEMLDIPDIEDMYAEKNASRRVVRQRIEAMLDGGEYVPPEPYLNLAVARELVQASYLEACEHGAPDDRLEALRTYENQVLTLIQKAEEAARAAQQPQMAPPAMAPVAAPPPPQQMTPPLAMAA